jgi:3-oxoacyl-ACP reductase-like protein
LKAPPLPYKTAAEKKDDAKAAASATNAATPPAGDAKEDGKLAKAEKSAQAEEGKARAEEFEAKVASEAVSAGDSTEKDVILEPMAYERRQNYNKLKEYAPRPTPEPYIMRTTFY